MRLWIKAVLLTLWHGAKWLVVIVAGLWIGSSLAEVLPETAIAAICIAFMAAVLITFVAMLVFLFYVFVSDNHRRLEEREKQLVNWDPPAKIDPDRGAVYTAGDGTRWRIGGHGKERR